MKEISIALICLGVGGMIETYIMHPNEVRVTERLQPTETIVTNGTDTTYVYKVH